MYYKCGGLSVSTEDIYRILFLYFSFYINFRDEKEEEGLGKKATEMIKSSFQWKIAIGFRDATLRMQQGNCDEALKQ